MRNPKSAMRRGDRGYRDRLERQVAGSSFCVTALTPEIGYEAATDVARDASETVRPLAVLLAARGLLGQKEAEEILRPERFLAPR